MGRPQANLCGPTAGASACTPLCAPPEPFCLVCFFSRIVLHAKHAITCVGKQIKLHLDANKQGKQCIRKVDGRINGASAEGASKMGGQQVCRPAGEDQLVRQIPCAMLLEFWEVQHPSQLFQANPKMCSCVEA